MAQRPSKFPRITKFPKLFIFDCETTGRSPQHGRIIELAVQQYIPGEEMDSMRPLSMLVNPGNVRSNWKARSIHKISDSDLLYAASFPAVWRRIVAYIEAWTDPRTEVPVIVAHNSPFEKGFLWAEFDRNDISYPENFRISCSLALSRKIWPKEKASLAILAKNAGLAKT